MKIDTDALLAAARKERDDAIRTAHERYAELVRSIEIVRKLGDEPSPVPPAPPTPAPAVTNRPPMNLPGRFVRPALLAFAATRPQGFTATDAAAHLSATLPGRRVYRARVFADLRSLAATGKVKVLRKGWRGHSFIFGPASDAATPPEPPSPVPLPPPVLTPLPEHRRVPRRPVFDAGRNAGFGRNNARYEPPRAMGLRNKCEWYLGIGAGLMIEPCRWEDDGGSGWE